MRAKDVEPARLAAAREAARAFLEKIPEKFRVGVVGFSGRALDGALPPTEDRALARQALRSLRPGEGTSLGDASFAGVQLGRRQRAKDGTVPPTAILVISDGANMSGRTTPDAAARQARSSHVPVYAIVLGTENGIVTVDPPGRHKRTAPRAIEPRNVAPAFAVDRRRVLHGPRRRAAEGRLWEARLATRHRRQSREISDVFAGGSAALLLVGGALSALWFRRVP